MFTTLDKAIVALVMGVLFIMNSVFGLDFGLEEETVSGIIGVLTPILVYFIPNKRA